MKTWLTIALASAVALLTSCGSAVTEASSTSNEKGFVTRWFAPKTIAIPAGTVITVRIETALSTESNNSGDRFRASLSAPLLHAGKVVLPAGTDAQGVVISSDKGGRVKGVATMSLRLVGIQAGSRAVAIETDSVTFSARTRHGKDAVTVGIGSGIGAAIGALAGGGKGAAVGTAAGAGAGTGVVLGTHGDQVHIAPETRLTFPLRQPITIPSIPAS